jgi:hypothetical protein
MLRNKPICISNQFFHEANLMKKSGIAMEKKI